MTIETTLKITSFIPIISTIIGFVLYLNDAPKWIVALFHTTQFLAMIVLPILTLFL